MSDLNVDVSVIIATYNVEHYIERSVRSALAQEGVRLEIIIVDDCSSDNTCAVASSIMDERIRVFRFTENKGPSVARNKAISEAKGRWIAVLDGDDAFEAGRLARCIGKAKRHNADIVVDNINVYREEDGKTFQMFPKSWFSGLDIIALADFIDGNKSFFGGGYPLGYLKPVFLKEFLFSRCLFYDPDIRIGEDYMLFAGLLANGALCVVEQSAGYVYTVRSGSISHRLSLDDIKRIYAGDKKFTSRYVLDAESAKAQKRREASLDEIYRFTLLVNALKRLDIVAVLKVILLYPLAARHLWRPFYARTEKYVRTIWNIYVVKANLFRRPG